jgi:hypothetical protein
MDVIVISIDPWSKLSKKKKLKNFKILACPPKVFRYKFIFYFWSLEVAGRPQGPWSDFSYRRPGVAATTGLVGHPFISYYVKYY